MSGGSAPLENARTGPLRVDLKPLGNPGRGARGGRYWMALPRPEWCEFERCLGGHRVACPASAPKERGGGATFTDPFL